MLKHMKHSEMPDCVNPNAVTHVKQILPEAETVEKIAAICSLLSDPGRVRIVLALSEKSLCVYELSLIIEASVSAVSHQLRKLKDRGIVSTSREGKKIIYSLNEPMAKEIISVVHPVGKKEEVFI